MRALTLMIALAVAPGIAIAAEQSCDRYAALQRLPDSFEEIASADLVKAELFVLTDGTCTCENMPAVNRKLGKPAPEGVNWLCRAATADERRSNAAVPPRTDPSELVGCSEAFWKRVASKGPIGWAHGRKVYVSYETDGVGCSCELGKEPEGCKPYKVEPEQRSHVKP